MKVWHPEDQEGGFFLFFPRFNLKYYWLIAKNLVYLKESDTSKRKRTSRGKKTFKMTKRVEMMEKHFRKKVCERLRIAGEGVERFMLLKDTPEAIELKYRLMLKDISNERRLKMGCSMFKLAGSFIICSPTEQGISSDELRKHLFLRIYGDDFDEDVKKSIMARL